MIIIFNLIGLGMLVVAGSLAGFFVMVVGCKLNEEWVLSHAMFAGMLASGFFMIVLDIGYRMTRGKRSKVFEGLENTKGSLIHPRSGGHLGYIPIWVWGAFFIVGQLYVAFGSKADVSARQSNPYGTRDSGSQNSSDPPLFGSYSGSSETIWSLKLGMISGVDPHRVATINGQPFAEGESHKLTLGTTKGVTVQCKQIREQSVVLTVSRGSQPIELKAGERMVLLRKGWVVSQQRD